MTKKRQKISDVFDELIPRRKVVLFGCGRLNLGLIGDLFQEAGSFIVAINTRDQDIVAALDTARHYRIQFSNMHFRKVDVERGLLYDVTNPSSEASRTAIEEAARAQIIVSGVGRSEQLMEALTIPFIRDVLECRLTKNIVQELDICGSENPIGHRTATDVLRDLLARQIVGEERLMQHVSRHIRFPHLIPDRICTKRRIADDGVVEIQAEDYRELIVGGASWNFERIKVSAPKGMCFVDTIDNYRRRKLYVLSLTHAIAAYLGAYAGYPTIADAMNDSMIDNAVRTALDSVIRTFQQTGGIDEHNIGDYAMRAVERIKNPKLNDDVYRVGRDPGRKLSKEDRLVGPALFVMRYSFEEPKAMIATIGAALCFCVMHHNLMKKGQPIYIDIKEKDENAITIGEKLFQRSAKLEDVVLSICGLSKNDKAEFHLAHEIVKAYCHLQTNVIQS